MGKKVVVKERFSKKYRHPVLDSKLTLKRLYGVGPSSVSSLFSPTLHFTSPNPSFARRPCRVYNQEDFEVLPQFHNPILKKKPYAS